MTSVNVLKFATASPDDTSALARSEQAGYKASDTIEIIGKTEAVWKPLIPPGAGTIFSGGTEGVLSPHVTLIVREHEVRPSPSSNPQSQPSSGGLVAVAGRTRTFLPQEIGGHAQSSEVASTVRFLLRQSDIPAEDVAIVLVKCPLLTTANLNIIRAIGQIPVVTNADDSMAKSRYASAIGVNCGLSLGSAVDEMASIQGELQNGGYWGTVASCSAGAEVDDCQILILANSTTADNDLRAVSGYMYDSIDGVAITSLLRIAEDDDGNVVQLFAKAEPSPDGLIRGKRHTMDTDSDLRGTRPARAAVGGLAVGLIGDPEIYLNGGAEGQGPPGGGSLCLIYRIRK